MSDEPEGQAPPPDQPRDREVADDRRVPMPYRALGPNTSAGSAAGYRRDPLADPEAAGARFRRKDVEVDDRSTDIGSRSPVPARRRLEWSTL